MLIWPSSLDTALAEGIMTSGRSPYIIDEDRFEVSHHYFRLLILTISHHLRWCSPDANDTPVHSRGKSLFHLLLV